MKKLLKEMKFEFEGARLENAVNMAGTIPHSEVIKVKSPQLTARYNKKHYIHIDLDDY